MKNQKQLTPEDITFGYISDLVNTMLLPENNKLVYGYVLNKLDRVIDKTPMKTAKMSTACVSTNPPRININAEFMSYFPKNNQIGILMHEVLHMANKHMERFYHIYHPIKKREDMSLKEKFDWLMKCNVANEAMDIAITQFNKDDPADFPEQYYIDHPNETKYKSGRFSTYDSIKDKITRYAPELLSKLKPFDSAEAYFRLLIEVNNKMPGKTWIMSKHFGNYNSDGDDSIPGPNDTIIDLDDLVTRSHMSSSEDLHNSNGSTNPMIEQILNNAIRHQRDADNKRGTLPGDSVLKAFPKPNVVVDKDLWKKIVDKAFGDEISANTDFRYGRPNRRDSDSFWYEVNLPVAKKVYIIFDTSYSVTDDQCAMITGYMSTQMKKYCIDATLILCDAKVQGTPTRIKRIPKIGLTLKGREGTSLTKALDWIELHERPKNYKNINIIMFTDGHTDWREHKMNIYAIYTKEHAKLNYIKDYAVFQQG